MTLKPGAIDAWAQPANGRARQLLPEVARLFEKSGSARWLDQPLSIEQTVALMDQAGVETLMLSAWCRPEGWVFSNDEIAAYTRAFPELVIVAGHIGHPWTDEMIGLAWKHDHVHIDTSAYYPPQLLHFMRTYGQDKVLFGSNFPQLSLKKCLEQVMSLELPPAIADKFLQGNARRVFGLQALATGAQADLQGA